MAARHMRLDTWAIIEAAAGGRHADRVEGILRRSGPCTYSLVVSRASLGEAIAVILRRGPRAAGMLRRMFALLEDCRAEPDSCVPPLDAKVLAVVRELALEVPGLDMADMAVLAHALADPDSEYLITKDEMLVNNSLIIAYEKNARAVGRRNTMLEVINPTETCPAL